MTARRAIDVELDLLRERPVPIDAWRDAQVGPQNSGPYREQYRALKIQEDSLNPLVDVSAYGIVSSDTYLDQLLNGEPWFGDALDAGLFFSRALLRGSHAARLARVDSYLRAHGLCIFIRSGWRHPAVQEMAVRACTARDGQAAADALFARVVPGMAPPPHSTGAALDAEVIVLESGEVLPMRIAIGGKAVSGLYELERLALRRPTDFLAGTEAGEALRNRRILHHVLCTRGVVFDLEKELFVEHPGEYWHFGDGDPLSAYLRGEQHARYGLTLPPASLWDRLDDSLSCSSDVTAACPEVEYRGMAPGEEQSVLQIVMNGFDEFVRPACSSEGVVEFERIARQRILTRSADYSITVAAGRHGPVGMIGMRDSSHVSLFYVARRHQAQGIGRRLMECALTDSLARRPNLAAITVNSSPFAVPVYKKLGFEIYDGNVDQTLKETIPMIMTVPAAT